MNSLPLVAARRSMETLAGKTAFAANMASQMAANALPSGSLAPDHEKWLRWEDVEVVQPGEEQTAQQIADVIQQLQRKNAAIHGQTYRATHLKTQALLKGRLRVNPDLPSHLQHGLFAHPGQSHDLIARFANEPYKIMPDPDGQPRGVAFKVFDVEGEKMDGSEGSTQDFFFNNAPQLELTNIDTTLEIFQLRLKYFDDPEGLKKALSERKDSLLQHAPSKLPFDHILKMDMFTQSAYRFGPHVAHFSLHPVSEAQTSLSAPDKTDDAERSAISAFFEEHEALYTLRAQFASSKAWHPVEDASTLWPESSSPYYELATIVFPRQTSFSTGRLDWWEKSIALSPFNGLKAHQPLGSVNRLRKTVYAASRSHRDEMNGKRSEFVTSVDEMPA